MSKFITEDNSCQALVNIIEAERNDLFHISQPTIGELCEGDNSNLLIFPTNLKQYGDEIGSSHICTIIEDKLYTGNIMGFVGVSDTQLTIRSRFATKGEEDYFMHYMLQKVFSINVFDLKHSSSDESVFDFLLYLFPYFLKKALRQGLFKQYKSERHNDSSIKGVIDINRHIKSNIPFAGKIAYNARVRSCDNNVTQLVRHTIEYIDSHKFGGSILKTDADTKECVGKIRNATPTYNPNERHSILNKNLKPINHPYYSEYTILQKICKQILMHKGLKYGAKSDRIYGLLFDGAWLWEEYLNTILRECGFNHPLNKTRKGKVHLFEDGAISRFERYPDFYIPNHCVLDAKYKIMKNHSTNNDVIHNEDINQLITYMYVENAPDGGFIHPTTTQTQKKEFGILRGYKGRVSIIDVQIPQKANSFQGFSMQMKNGSENIIREHLIHYNHKS